MVERRNSRDEGCLSSTRIESHQTNKFTEPTFIRQRAGNSTLSWENCVFIKHLSDFHATSSAECFMSWLVERSSNWLLKLCTAQISMNSPSLSLLCNFIISELFCFSFRSFTKTFCILSVPLCGALIRRNFWLGNARERIKHWNVLYHDFLYW